MNLKPIFLTFSLVLSLTAVVSACKNKGGTGTTSSSGEIVIGEVGSLTGSEATFGISTRNAIDLALEEANAAGGIQGRKLRVVVLDDQGKPEEAATAVTRLITQDKVVAILGEVASSRSIAMAPIAQQNKVPMVTPASTNPKVTEIGDYIFRVCFIDPFQGPVIAKFVSEELGLKRVAILRDIKNDYSIGLAKFFKEKFLELGGEVVLEQSYSNGDIDFKAQLTAIKGAKPEFIYLPGYYTDVGLIVRQARELGIKVPFGGGDGWDSDKLYEIGGAALEGSFYSNHYSPDEKRPVLQKFVADYKAKYGAVPDGMAALGYDGARVLIDAMKRAKSLAGPDLRDAIAQTKNFEGVTGNITINEKRDAVKPAVVLKVSGGKQVYVKTVQP